MAVMQIHIRFAEPFWRTIGQRNIALEIEEGATVSDLLADLSRAFPALGQEMNESPPIVIVEDVEAKDDLLLQEDMLLHFLWPIAGG